MLPALVLSAGLGTRLDPLTRLVAKPAVPLGGRTLIAHVLTWLTRHDVRTAVINLHHRPETITAAVGDGAHLGLHVRYSWEFPLLGSAGGPRRALPLLDAPHFLIVNGDTLCDVDLGALVAAHRARGAAVTMAVVPNTRPDHYNSIAATREGDVIGFVPRSAATPRGAAEPGVTTGLWHFVGVQVVDASVFAPLADGVPAETVHGIYRDLVARGTGLVRIFPTPAPFIDVGTPRDYLETALSLASPGALAPSLSRSVVWPTATVGTGVRLHECIVAGDVTVPDGFTAEQAILAPLRIATEADVVDRRAGIAVFPIAGASRGSRPAGFA